MEFTYTYKIPDRLYHASPNCFRHFSLEKARPLKDFGRGFYLTSNRMQAMKWANLRRKPQNNGYVYEYSVDREKTINTMLNVMEFLDYDPAWAHFVAAHRHEVLTDPGLDLVYDRMADSTSGEITFAVDNLYRNVTGSTELLMEVLARQTAENRDYDQYCFKTQRAVDLLSCRGVYVMSGNRNGPVTRWKEAPEFYEQNNL